jgi:predicted MFS family arabinose efflux permease
VRISPAAAIAAATAGVAVSQVGLALASDVVVVGALLVLNSMALAVWNIAAVTVRQRLAPADTVGRVMSLSRTVIAVASTLAAVTGGLIAQFLSVRAAFLIGLPFVLVFSAWAVIRLRSSSGQSTMDS